MTIKLEGLKGLEDNLFRLKGSTAKSNVRAAMKEALEPAARLAREKAPILTGELQESIEITSRVNPRQFKKSDLEMYMGPGRNPQAVIQEFGSFKEPAQPYLRPAWDAKKMDVLDDFGARLWVRVEKAVKRAQAKAARDAAKLKKG